VKLYSYWRSSSSWRVRIVLHLKGVVFETVPINLAPSSEENTSPAYRALHPAEQVPLLVLDDPAGVALSQSVAIVELLEDRYREPPLLPKDALARARVREFVELINSGIQPLQNISLVRSVEQWTDETRARNWVGSRISAGLQRCQRLIQAHAGHYCFGDTLTLADAFLIPQLYAARRYAADLSGLDTLLGIEQRCQALPAFLQAHPNAQPDAPPGSNMS